MKSIHETTRQIRTFFTMEEVARILDNTLTMPHRLPGSPRLFAEFKDGGIVVTQEHVHAQVVEPELRPCGCRVYPDTTTILCYHHSSR